MGAVDGPTAAVSGRKGNGMRRLQQRGRLVVVAAASLVLLVLVLPEVATGIGLGSLAAHLVGSGCGSSGSSGSSGSGGSGGSGSGSSTCGPPVLSAAPTTGLADGQPIAVTGANFSAFSQVGLAECTRSPKGPVHCDLSTSDIVGTDGSGSFTTTYTVSRILDVGTKPGGASKRVDCAHAHCVLGAADLINYALTAFVPLSFRPHGTLALRGALASTDAVVTKTGVATIAGTVSCTRPGSVQIQVTLSQIYRKRFNFTNSGSTSVECTGRHTPWTVSVPPGIGLFGVGPATVDAEISEPIGNTFRTITLTRSVALQAEKAKK